MDGSTKLLCLAINKFHSPHDLCLAQFSRWRKRKSWIHLKVDVSSGAKGYADPSFDSFRWTFFRAHANKIQTCSIPILIFGVALLLSFTSWLMPFLYIYISFLTFRIHALFCDASDPQSPKASTCQNDILGAIFTSVCLKLLNVENPMPSSSVKCLDRSCNLEIQFGLAI